MDRETAEEFLSESDVEPGTYLIRPSNGNISHNRCCLTIHEILNAKSRELLRLSSELKAYELAVFSSIRHIQDLSVLSCVPCDQTLVVRILIIMRGCIFRCLSWQPFLVDTR